MDIIHRNVVLFPIPTSRPDGNTLNYNVYEVRMRIPHTNQFASRLRSKRTCYIVCVVLPRCFVGASLGAAALNRHVGRRSCSATAQFRLTADCTPRIQYVSRVFPSTSSQSTFGVARNVCRWQTRGHISRGCVRLNAATSLGNCALVSGARIRNVIRVLTLNNYRRNVEEPNRYTISRNYLWVRMTDSGQNNMWVCFDRTKQST